LGKKVAVFLFKRDAEALVIPNFGQPSLDPVAFRNRFEKIERDLVFGLDPFPRLRRVRIFQGPIRIGHFGAGIIIDLIADRCRRIAELRRWFSRKNGRDRQEKPEDEKSPMHKSGNYAEATEMSPSYFVERRSPNLLP